MKQLVTSFTGTMEDGAWFLLETLTGVQFGLVSSREIVNERTKERRIMGNQILVSSNSEASNLF